jgi:hypothetical protein
MNTNDISIKCKTFPVVVCRYDHTSADDGVQERGWDKMEKVKKAAKFQRNGVLSEQSKRNKDGGK